MRPECQLPVVSFGKIKNELLLANPALATMALTSQQTSLAQSLTFGNRHLHSAHTHLLIPDANRRRRNLKRSGSSDSGKYLNLNTNPSVYLTYANLEDLIDRRRTKKFRKSRRLSFHRPRVDFWKIRSEMNSLFPSYAMVPTRPMHPPEEFFLFKKLPMELQVEVWRHAFDDIGARVVSLHAHRFDVPSIIQACQVSRYEARKKFKFCVAQGLNRTLYRFFDARCDVFYLPHAQFSTISLEEMILPTGTNNCLLDASRIALDLLVAADAVSPERIAAQIVSTSRISLKGLLLTETGSLERASRFLSETQSSSRTRRCTEQSARRRHSKSCQNCTGQQDLLAEGNLYG